MENKIGFIIPDYPNEKRVALLPEHINDFDNEIIIERGFGSSMNISDDEYLKKGCSIKSRDEIFEECDVIFSLKLVQESDYDRLRKGQMIIGWTHPYGSGSMFMKNQVIPKELIVVDLDNISPRIYYKDKFINIDFIPRNFIVKNSITAGFASTFHALESFGLKPNYKTKVAILSSGNVAQGAFQAISLFGADIRMFYRKTMDEFLEKINSFDIVINGIEVDSSDNYIISKEDLQRMKDNSLIIDAAADAGNAVYGTRFTSHSEPIVRLHNNVFYYCVNNTPSIFYRNASFDISESFSKYVYSKNINLFYDKYKKLTD